jgi:hypothetical protein
MEDSSDAAPGCNFPSGAEIFSVELFHPIIRHGCAGARIRIGDHELIVIRLTYIPAQLGFIAKLDNDSSFFPLRCQVFVFRYQQEKYAMQT